MVTSAAQRMRFRGHSPRTFGAKRRTAVVRHPAQGASGTPPPTVVCILYVAACNAGAQPAHHFIRASDVILHPRPGGRGSPPLRWVGKVSACNRRRPSSGGRGVGDAAPYGLCVWVGVSINHSCPPSGAELDVAGRRDQLHPRLPRCACLASIAQRMRFRGHSPRTFDTGAPGVVLPPTPGGRGSPPLRVVRNAQKGPVCGPVLFALKCPRAFQAVFFTSTAHPKRRGWRLGRRRRRLWRR